MTFYDLRITLNKTIVPPLASSFLSLLPLGGGIKNNGKKGHCLFLISQPLWSCHYRDSFLSVFLSFLPAHLYTKSREAPSAKDLCEENECGEKEFTEKELVTCKLLETTFVK